MLVNLLNNVRFKSESNLIVSPFNTSVMPM